LGIKKFILSSFSWDLKQIIMFTWRCTHEILCSLLQHMTWLIYMSDAINLQYTLPENLLQLPPVDMQAIPILIPFYLQFNPKKLFWHSHCAQCTVTVHWSWVEVFFE
jgi:hypothetical protein